ncbi:hypothetical protein CLQ_14498 (plasmid) [Clostridium botulinum Af84]|uniref:hypothetical protein n=1 Tax=Clostridium botulinum TaxID=1491 RepID=UPI00035BA303|nr:hypothetical protein [Clostridium botulinum]APR02619.1 hypothetical protein RSJ2_3766 [Clostridium botulinum]AUN19823.1 hypothetical protein B2M06_19965 [Clostridium botulinum]EPS54505.1 hypothetical protein CLQ_14498 [Clostridium botulinum Af84]NFM84395.1 hypothetical protein [Clostridium botulinum]NFP13232.1 hypothetical protein [Clostridium botulinum]
MENVVQNYEVFQEFYLLNTKTGDKIFAPANVTIVLKNKEKFSCVLHEIKEDGTVILLDGKLGERRINNKDIISITDEGYF